MLNDAKLAEYIQMIDDAFYWDRWGHYISSIGLLKIFEPEQKFYFFSALKAKGIQRHSSCVNGTFCPFGGKFYYTPLFREKYWKKIVEIKKTVPIIAKKNENTLHGGKYVSHCYQMLTGQPLIPCYDELLANPEHFAKYRGFIVTQEQYKLSLKSKKI